MQMKVPGERSAVGVISSAHRPSDSQRKFGGSQTNINCCQAPTAHPLPQVRDEHRVIVKTLKQPESAVYFRSAPSCPPRPALLPRAVRALAYRRRQGVGALCRLPAEPASS